MKKTKPGWGVLGCLLQERGRVLGLSEEVVSGLKAECEVCGMGWGVWGKGSSCKWSVCRLCRCWGKRARRPQQAGGQQEVSAHWELC